MGNPVAASRQSAANFSRVGLSIRKCGALPRRRYAEIRRDEYAALTGLAILCIGSTKIPLLTKFDKSARFWQTTNCYETEQLPEDHLVECRRRRLRGRRAGASWLHGPRLYTADRYQERRGCYQVLD